MEKDRSHHPGRLQRWSASGSGIVSTVEEIYLFGSVARGDATTDSDVDLLIVVDDTTDFAAVDERLLDIVYEVTLEPAVASRSTHSRPRYSPTRVPSRQASWDVQLPCGSDIVSEFVGQTTSFQAVPVGLSGGACWSLRWCLLVSQAMPDFYHIIYSLSQAD